MNTGKSITWLWIAVFMVIGNLYSWSYLYVHDPRQWSGSDMGTIENATFEITPQGIYIDCGMTLTVSARGTFFGSSDTLEVVFDFDLPSGAIVHDMWLWIDGVPVQAKIFDRWTASDIYENIVRRRRDPAVLFKEGKNRYSLRIFPMAGNESRQIKINYLIPSEWLGKDIAGIIPTEILNTSKNPLSNIKIFNPVSENWGQPTVLEFDGITFTQIQDSLSDDYYFADILIEDQLQMTPGNLSPFNIAFKNPRPNGAWCSVFDYGGNGVYQLAFIPSQLFELSDPIKTVFLVDFDPSKSTVDDETLYHSLKTSIANRFTRKDSFNIILTGLNNLAAGDHWFSGDSAGIADAFTALGNNPFSTFSNIPGLLLDGIEFINAKNDTGQIILIADNDGLGDYRVANPLVSGLLDSMNTKIPIHIADYQNINRQWYYTQNRYYQGNEYFYINLSKLTGGNYFVLESSIGELLSKASAGLSGKVTSYDIYTSLSNGFTYGRYNFDIDDSKFYARLPILQTGRYWGSGDFHVQLSGIFGTSPFTHEITIPQQDIIAGDSLNEEIWTGNYISGLEEKMNYDYWYWYGNSNEDIEEIIDLSIAERVLSIYTSFISLDPNDSSWVNTESEEGDGGIFIGIDDENQKVTEFNLKAYPNPFNLSTKIEIDIPANTRVDDFSLIIYNIKGQKIKEFNPAMMDLNSNRVTLSWKGTNDQGQVVSTGVYFLVLKSGATQHTLKLVLVK